MNPMCPTCKYNWALNGLPEGGTVPYEENDEVGTLQFCSEECRDEFVEGDR